MIVFGSKLYLRGMQYDPQRVYVSPDGRYRYAAQANGNGFYYWERTDKMKGTRRALDVADLPDNLISEKAYERDVERGVWMQAVGAFGVVEQLRLFN